MRHQILADLIAMSRHLGEPERDYVILGEGNTSAQIDADSFWVKASGTELNGIDADGFVQVRFEPILAMLEGPDLSDEEIRRVLGEAKADPDAPGHPSVETAVHAVCLSLHGVNFVGHTHPTAINSITCSTAFEAAYAGRLFPDEIVLCGPAALLVPYVDPGLSLARAVRRHIDDYLDRFGEPPKTIMLQNHGLFALGSSAAQVEKVTAMAVKAARVLIGAYALGGPHFMSREAVERIHTRSDEDYRRRVMAR
ncbi:MAG: class II aldolase [Caldilineae bacterium]|nr:MAG: class II aldolase [Caldilineae bacterium]